MRSRCFLNLLFLSMLLGCGTSAVDRDSGVGAGSDTGTSASGKDASSVADATPLDAAVNVDGGAVDSGPGADTGPSPDGGAPTDAGDVDAGAPSGACTNAADQAIHNSIDVSDAVGTCASDCFGAGPCVRRCITNDIGLSSECTECYVDVTRCTVQNCIADCAGADSAACEACRDAAGCTSDFDTCSGL